MSSMADDEKKIDEVLQPHMPLLNVLNEQEKYVTELQQSTHDLFAELDRIHQAK